MDFDSQSQKTEHRQIPSSMGTPIPLTRTQSTQTYSSFAQSSQTRALVEEDEVYHDENHPNNIPAIYRGKDFGRTCVMQSAELTTTDETVVREEGERQEVITFNDGSGSVSVDAPDIQDESVYDGFSANVDLATYLARPVLISTISWSQGATISTVLKPWELYFTNASIERKLQNYAFLACNLRVKIVINASPFFYGLAFATYRPYIGNAAGRISQAYTKYGPTMAATCRQRLDILPSKSQGGEMCLPYINVRNWLRIGKLLDFQEMGDIHIWSHDVLEFANAASGPDVSIQVFAWAEDVKVSGPTAQLPMQASDEYEETGPISGIASSVASMAGTAERILPGPFKPFAKATEIGASAVSSIASLFGFTNVPVLDDVSAFKNLPFHALASTQISCPFEKLTLDPKNELTIDNRVAGGKGVDELTIPYLCGKKNVWSLPNWAASDAAGADIIEINVSPMLIAELDGNTVSTAKGTITPIYQAPMTLVARNFKFWRGTMVYRFKFICTQYHRGRIGIIWDPVHSTTADYNYTENYTRIVDISEEQEIVIKVPFMQPYPYLETGWDSLKTNITTPVRAADAFNELLHNGKLVLRVLTKQTSPVATADILMYVETSMEDADFANPIDVHSNEDTRTSYFVIQSAEDEVKVVEDNIAKMEIRQNPNLHKIYNGEAVFSMRQLMRRRSFYRSIFASGNISARYYAKTIKLNRRPSFYGYDPNGSSVVLETVGVGNHRFGPVSEPLCNLFEPCFVGQRGSHNYEINLNKPGNACDTLLVSRYLKTITADSWNDTIISTAAAQYQQNLDSLEFGFLSGRTGVAMTNARTQTGLQVQIPMYSRYRFLSTDPNERALGVSADGTDVDNILIGYRAQPISDAVTQNPSYFQIDMYHSIGTDYQLLHFVNVPEAWIYAVLPSTT